MQVLFLHTALNGLNPEYKVHMNLVMKAKNNDFNPYFIWQSPIDSAYSDWDRIIPYDFGRNMSIMPKPSRYHRAALAIRRLPNALAFLISQTERIKPDLIYTSQQSSDVFFATILSRFLHIPHIIHIHYSVGPWLGRYTLRAIKKSPRLIAVSEYIRQTALLQGVSPSAIDTVINFPPIPQPIQAHQTIRAEFNLEENTPLIVAVGRLDPGKGYIPLFEAFAQVIHHMPNARLLICGASTSRNHYEDYLKQRVNELQINHHTIFAGQRNDITAIMRSANVFCLPTELDPCPLVFLEAMAEGLPVVAYYSGGVPEMVLHTQTGLLSYPGDIPTLARNLERVLSDTTYAQHLGEAGKQRVTTEFAPTKITDHWLDVLHSKIS